MMTLFPSKLSFYENSSNNSMLRVAVAARVFAGAKGWQEAAKNIKTCFSSVLNGCDSAFRRGVLVHVCRNRCCASRRDAENKVIWAVLKVLFRVLPTTPLMADWSKIGPCLDFFLQADFAGLLERLLAEAQWAEQISQRENPPGEEHEFHEKVDWHKLAGTRFKRTCKMLSSAQERFERLLLAVVMEPLRHLHDAFLKYAHSAPDETSWPTLLSEVWPRTSTHVSALQYYASCLAGATSRLKLIVNLSEDFSLRAWMQAKPEQARAVRDKLLSTAAFVRRRFSANVDRFPFRLFGLADGRRASEHDGILEQFFAMAPCCLPAGFARELRETMSQEEFQNDILSFRWLFLLTSLIVKMSIAGVERRHAQHRRQANVSMPFYMFSACSTLTEARHQQLALARMAEERRRRRETDPQQLPAGSRTRMVVNAAAAAAAAPDSVVPARVAKKARTTAEGPAATPRLKSKSALEIFRTDWIASQRALGKVVNPCSKECWVACRAAFQALTPERQEEFRARALASQVETHAVRQQKRKRKEQGPGNPEAPLAEQPPVARSESALAVPAVPRSQLPEVDARPPFPQHVACQSLRASFVQQAAGEGGEDARQSAVGAQFPMTPDALKERIRGFSSTFREAAKDFRQRASHIATGPSVPEVVEYPACCGELCHSSNTLRTCRFHARVVSLLEEAVKASVGVPKGWAKLVPAAGIVFAAECYTAVDNQLPSGVAFYAVACAAGRQAHHAAQTTLVQLEPLQLSCAAWPGRSGL